jgi:hypothetical protein
MSDSFALGDGPYHFFARSSFSAAWSSIDSAGNFFSMRFSPSSDRSVRPDPNSAWKKNSVAGQHG